MQQLKSSVITGLISTVGTVCILPLEQHKILFVCCHFLSFLFSISRFWLVLLQDNLLQSNPQEFTSQTKLQGFYTAVMKGSMETVVRILELAGLGFPTQPNPNPTVPIC